MVNVKYDGVNITGGFWGNWKELNRKITVNSVYNRFYDTGRINAFECSWKDGKENKPHYYWDSDVAKWIEGSSYILKKHYNEDLHNRIKFIIDCIEKNQQEDGYFNIYYTVCEPGNRFTERNNHELYCAGHLIEAAIAYHDATGEDKFLKCMMKYADLIYKIFLEENSAAFMTPGHEEIELALFKLYRYTKMEKYLKLAVFFLEKRGNNDKDANINNKCTPYSDQHHKPVREQKEAQGHSVRALYLYSAMADMEKETGDKVLLDTLKSLFDDMVEKKMYVTGGVGSTWKGEAFTIPYDLPNDTAYCETCASIAMILFCERMGEITGESKYADIIEKELYNGMLSGISLDGRSFFYENPLEINLESRMKDVSWAGEKERYPITQRLEVFDCSCCPPNIVRTLASVERLIYSIDKCAVYINQFMPSKYENIEIKTDFPHGSEVTIINKSEKEVRVRIPMWCEKFDADAEYRTENGYAVFPGTCNIIHINLNQEPVLIQCDPRVRANENKVCLMRGPVVYCMERIDNGEKLSSLYVDKEMKAELEEDNSTGEFKIKIKGFKRLDSDAIYKRMGFNFEDRELIFVPFHTFANRGESDMRVWVNYR